VAYQSGDDPQLLSDLRAALKRWRRPTLGDTALAGGLADVERWLAADPALNRSEALRQMLGVALASLRGRERAEEADLLERRYLHHQSVTRLTEIYHLSERSMYDRLREALLALAHAVWALDQAGAGTNSDSPLLPESPAAISRARNLPPRAYSQLFGMDEVLAQLLEYLEAHDGHWVISLDGMAGLGKTALAREAAGRLSETIRSADIAWVRVSPTSYPPQGAGEFDLPTLTCGQVLDSMAGQLTDADLSALPLPANRDRVRELLHAAPCLVVLDSLETSMDCGTWPDWFWDMANPSKFLLTSRHWLESEVEPTVLSLNQLTDSEGMALIRLEAQLRGLSEVAGAGDDGLRPILEVTGGNPLAIKLVVGQLVSLPLSRILAGLHSVQPGADSFYQYLYRISWDTLSAPARILLTRMARLPASDGTWEDLAAISGLDGEELDAAIRELTAHSLVQAAGFEKRYCLHPLTLHFAASRAERPAGQRPHGTIN